MSTSTKIDRKSIENRGLKAPTSRSGGVLEGSRTSLGPSWAFRSLFLPFWWVLSASCGPQEANMASPRWGPNRCQNRCKKSMRLGPPFWSIFWILGANLALKWRQVGVQNRTDVGNPENVRKAPWLQPGFAFYDFCDASWQPNTFKNRSKKSGTWEGILLLFFGRFWKTTWEPKWTKNRSRKASKTEAILECVLG